MVANFITSSTDISNVFEAIYTEIVFLGRSNVGKSSLINALTKKKNLAKSSSTPGKTRLINFFEVLFDNKQKVILIDLPGFGYAKVSKEMRANWDKNLDDFLRGRDNIRPFIHLIDARHPKLDIDNSISEYLESIKKQNQEVLKVFTKVDKLNQKELDFLRRNFIDSISVSCLNKKNIDFLREKIYAISFGN